MPSTFPAISLQNSCFLNLPLVGVFCHSREETNTQPQAGYQGLHSLLSRLPILERRDPVGFTLKLLPVLYVHVCNPGQSQVGRGGNLAIW